MERWYRWYAIVSGFPLSTRYVYLPCGTLPLLSKLYACSPWKSLTGNRHKHSQCGRQGPRRDGYGTNRRLLKVPKGTPPAGPSQQTSTTLPKLLLCSFSVESTLSQSRTFKHYVLLGSERPCITLVKPSWMSSIFYFLGEITLHLCNSCRRLTRDPCAWHGAKGRSICTTVASVRIGTFESDSTVASRWLAAQPLTYSSLRQ